MRNLDYIEKDSNNDFIVRFNTNNNFDRTSLYLYPNATNTGYASHPPHIEEYGCESFNVLQRYSNAGTRGINFEDDSNYNEFDPSGSSPESQTYLERFCPQYQINKLYPVKRNNNNTLANKIGALNLTFLAKQRLASPFFYNGSINGVTLGGITNDGVPSPYICYNKSRVISSGYQPGPRFVLVSNNIVITAKHYTNPNNPEALIGNTYTIIGTDDVEYGFQIIYAETSKDELESLDTHVFKIQGYGPNPIETGIALNKVKPISLLDGNYSNVGEEELFRHYIYSIAPIITIDIENRVGLDVSHNIGGSSYGFKSTKSNLFYYYSLTEYLEKFNLNDVFTRQDINAYALIGDSSSPYFILENNIPILLGLYTSYVEIEKYFESKNRYFVSFIKNFAVEQNCNLPNIIKLSKNNLIEKINKFKTSTDNLIYLIGNTQFYKDTDNILQEKLTVFPIQNNIKYQIQNNIFYGTAINFLKYKIFNFSLGSTPPNLEIFSIEYEITKPSSVEQQQDKEIYCTEDVKINYDKTQFNYNTFINSNNINKKLLNSTGAINHNVFNEKLHKQSKIILKRNQTYYFNIDTQLNNFYVSEEPNNLNTAYTSGFKKVSQKMYYELSPETLYNIDLQVINLHNLECDYEQAVFPIQHNILNLNDALNNVISNCNATSSPELLVSYSLQDYFLLKFEVPSDCPSKLYFCTNAGYTEIIIENEKPTLEKINKISYLNITPKVKITNNEELDFGREFIAADGVLGQYFRTCRQYLPCDPFCFPNYEEDIVGYNNYIKSVLDEQFPYVIKPDNSKLSFIDDKEIKASDNYGINIIRKD